MVSLSSSTSRLPDVSVVGKCYMSVGVKEDDRCVRSDPGCEKPESRNNVGRD